MAPCDSVPHLPVGFKFRPTDEELLGYYLLNKICSPSFMYENVVPEINLYGHIEPWDIWNEHGGQKLQKGEDLYFFTRLKKVCEKGSNVVRTIGSGTWKGENSGTDVYNPENKEKLGFWKRLKYENSNSDQNGCWIMHEFNLDPLLVNRLNPKSNSSSGNDDQLVLCRIRKNDKKRKLSDAEEDNQVDVTPVQSQNKIQRQRVTSFDELVGTCTPMSEVNEVIPHYGQQQEQETAATSIPVNDVTHLRTGFSQSQPDLFTADFLNMVSPLACLPPPEPGNVPNMVSSLACLPQAGIDYVELNDIHQTLDFQYHFSQLDNGYDDALVTNYSCQLGTRIDDNKAITESFIEEQPSAQFGDDQTAKLNVSHFSPDDFLKYDEDDALQPSFLGMESCTTTPAAQAKGNKITEDIVPTSSFCSTPS